MDGIHDRSRHPGGPEPLELLVAALGGSKCSDVLDELLGNEGGRRIELASFDKTRDLVDQVGEAPTGEVLAVEAVRRLSSFVETPPQKPSASRAIARR